MEVSVSELITCSWTSLSFFIRVDSWSKAGTGQQMRQKNEIGQNGKSAENHKVRIQTGFIGSGRKKINSGMKV